MTRDTFKAKGRRTRDRGPLPGEIAEAMETLATTIFDAWGEWGARKLPEQASIRIDIEHGSATMALLWDGEEVDGGPRDADERPCVCYRRLVLRAVELQEELAAN